MAYENVRIRKPNFTIVDGYFWFIDDEVDSIIVKTDDGTTAYSYPLDTTITETVKSIEYDGKNIWTLRETGTGELTIDRWQISNYVCTLKQQFTLSNPSTHTYDSEAFTVEHYHLTLNAIADVGDAIVYVLGSSTELDALDTGKTIVFGPSTAVGYEGSMEEREVKGEIGGTVQLDAGLTYKYAKDDPVTFYTNIWLFNNYNGTDDTSGALYKINPYTESYVAKYALGAFKDIKSCTFFNVPYKVFNPGSSADTPYYNSICYVKGPNLIFLDPNNPLTASFGSMTMDNVRSDNATNIPIYDLVMNGTNVYRLQTSATYYGTTYSFNNYNYQLSSLNSFITSISLSADPAILPATGSSSATVTAVVKDQFNLPVVSRLVEFTDDDDDGYIQDTTVNTDGSGVAETTYISGLTAREVRLTATASQA